MGAPGPAILVDMIRRERLRRAAEGSLVEFIRQAWPVIEPGVEFRDNWHLHAMADHLEALTHGEIDNLILNIPPGCMKSLLTSVAWPVWEWLGNPSLRYMCASYGSDLSIRDTLKTRDILLSEWFQSNWPDIRIKPGEDQKTKYALINGGWRMATSTGGRATGEHPDRKIVDDPHNAKQAESDAERQMALDWFDRTLSTRGESRGAKTIVVMQRLHENDLTGHILEKMQDLGNYELLCLPMEFEGDRRVTSIGWSDPRREVGDLLWPEMFNEKSVHKLRVTLGEYGAAGQLQQRPSPAGGGIIKTAHFQLWPAKKPLPAFDYVLQSYDTAYSEKTTGDPSTCTVWGVFTYDDGSGRRGAMLLDAWAERISYPTLRERVINDWAELYAADPKTGRRGRRADNILVEEKSSGISLLQDLRLANVPAMAYNPGRADKIARAHRATPLLETECFYIPESGAEAGKPATWAREFLAQCEKFPNAANDDYVDTWTQATIWLRDNGWLDLQVYEEHEPEYADDRRRIVNPYGA